MHFAKPEMLHLLWFIIPLTLFLHWSYRYRLKLVLRFVEEHLLVNMAPDYQSGIYFKKSLFLLLCYIFAVISLARPQWGFEWQEIKRQGVDILIAIDTSKSMLTQDVKPNRLERTKLAVRDLLQKLRGDRIGLIAFAGDAFLVCPLTNDYDGFLLSLNDLNVNSIPRGGTNIGEALTVAMSSYEKSETELKSIVLLTDGDNLEGDPLKIVNKARERGIKVYAVGIGTSEGEPIRIRDDAGDLQYMKDQQGNIIYSRLNEALLSQMAISSGGVYVKAGGADFGLDVIYDRYLSQLEKNQFESRMEKRYYERFQIPLALALLFLVLATVSMKRDKKR